MPAIVGDIILLNHVAMNASPVDEPRLAAIRVWRARYGADAGPLIEELRRLGLDVRTVGELYNHALPYRSALPALLDWLPRVENPIVKEDIVRALSVPWARGTDAAMLLVSEFERADDPHGTGLRWAIGNAIEATADDRIASEMLRLATDARYGRAREMVVFGLGKLKDPRIPAVLLQLLDDEQVVGHALGAVARLKATVARARVESLLNHPKPWVRKEAKKALVRLDRSR